MRVKLHDQRTNIRCTVEEEGSHLISGFVADDEEHRTMSELNTILDEGSDAVVHLLPHPRPKGRNPAGIRGFVIASSAR